MSTFSKVNYAAHEKIQRDIQKFLNGGGQINPLPGFKYKPIPERKIFLESKSEYKKKWISTPCFFDSKNNVFVRKWCKEKVGRTTRLAEQTGLSQSTISYYVRGYSRIKNDLLSDMKLAMSAIEKKEAKKVGEQ